MIIAVLGLPRSGKTAFATFLLRLMSLLGLPVYANYNLIGISNFKYVYACDLLDLWCCGLGLDEAYSLYESRNSNSKISRFDSLLPFQSGKRGVIVVYTAQLEGSVDKRMRQLADYRYAVVKDEVEKKFVYAPVLANDDIDYDSALEIPFSFMKDFVFGYYDTFERILPIGFRELVLEASRTEPSKMLKIVDAQIDLVLANAQKYRLFSARDATKSRIEYILLRLD